MSTGLLSMQSFGGFGGHESNFDVKMASDVTNLYHPQDCWDPPSYSNEPRTITANYMRFQPPSGTNSDGCRSEYANTSASTSYTTPPMFRAANAMAQSQNAPTVSPHQTHFDPNKPSSQSYSGSTPDGIKGSKPSNHIDGSMVQARNDSHSSSKDSNGGRRRKSESVEVGSARAIYLEKNRKAASKCRNKQKRQQEDLVEEARDVERKNKCLKAEVEMLSGCLREMMDVVAQHNNCPDSRLRLYLQREADRLAATGGSGILPYQYQPKTVSASHGLLSPEENSPPRPQ